MGCSDGSNDESDESSSFSRSEIGQVLFEGSSEARKNGTVRELVCSRGTELGVETRLEGHGCQSLSEGESGYKLSFEAGAKIFKETEGAEDPVD